MALNHRKPKALFFDVFGTCVDWRKSVTDALWNGAREALNSPTSSIATRIRVKATDMTYEEWGAIAQEWRNSYLAFTRSIAQDPSKAYKTVDEHHLEALHEILINHGLIFPPSDPSTPSTLAHDGSLWDEPQLQELNLIWHRLSPWPDTNAGLALLNTHFTTATLSNGNLSLLTDMVASADMPFTHVLSAEMFASYKPSPKVYLGAAAKLGLQAEECALVAAHLDDLKAAKANGFSTVYVERPLEERHLGMRGEEGIVDVWVTEGEEGFVEAARKLGC